MNRKPAIFSQALQIVLLLSILLGTSACGSLKFWCWGCGDSRQSDDARLHHVVLMWLKLPGNPTYRQRLIDASRKFADIPGVKDLRVGSSVPSTRNTVDDSFDVAVVISFADKAALLKYLDHPEHLRAVKATLEPLVDRMVVYDFIEPFGG